MSTIISLAGEDMAADEAREWGAAGNALRYLEKLCAWHAAKTAERLRRNDREQ